MFLLVEKFIECGGYSKGIARIKCTNPECGYEYFRPFCRFAQVGLQKLVSLSKLRPTGCGKCRRGQDVQEPANQKRLLLFAEPLSENVLFRLPHRQFVFTVPKILRLYFKYDRNLFEDVSRIIFSIIQDFYNESAPAALKTASVVSYQLYGDLM